MDHKISETSTNGTKTIPTGLLVFEILPKNGLFSLFIDGFRVFKKACGKRSKVFEKSEIDL